MLLKALDCDAASHLQIVKDLQHGVERFSARFAHGCSNVRSMVVKQPHGGLWL